MGRPPVNVRHEMLGEAVEIIGEPFTGGFVNRSGGHPRDPAGLSRGRLPTARAHDRFRRLGRGWKVDAALPGTAAFAEREVLPAPGEEYGKSDAPAIRR